jgi:hypothetical protein
VTEIRVEDVVFCEGFRNELGGKHTILGASAPEISTSQLPAVITAAVWISGRPSAIGPFSFEFRARDEKGHDLINGTLGGETYSLGLVAIPIGPFPLTIEKPGKVIFEWCFDKLNWTIIGTLKIDQTSMTPV